ncbi:M23 family metallopeptidase [Helicobacter anatolicus]|uniref:M23 family metallopeptidase n=1 Tax=Helicobacter anatolicus TaxID=2905874 RepID=UPI001E4415DE|nr:M23 family metallopeptidase [Helicobacter anatolicus]MCE3039317.1 peptidoglycan DD-metalloendopeptidase family protein [Helicobacter anatolicus]
MYNKLVVTIVDEKGSKQFQVHRYIKKIIFWGIFGFIFIIIGAFFFMKFLMQTIEDVAMEQNIAISEYRYIYQQNEELKERIQKKTNELNVIHQRIGDLETIIDTQKNKQQIDKFEEVDLKSLDDVQKDLILNLVPNGDPIKDFFSKSKTYSKEKNKNKEALAIFYKTKPKTPVYAASDGVVEIIIRGQKKNSSNGNAIKLNHLFGFNSWYKHLDEIVIKRGEFVKKGELIGYVGSYGNGLYYEISFLNKLLSAENFTLWGMDNFDEIILNENKVDWKSLVWIIQDILKLQDYQNPYYEKVYEK